jgi:lipopolysaccharide transport system ATP-binding protein
MLEVDGVSKLYRLGIIGTGTLSNDLKRWWHLIRGKEDPYSKIGEINKRNETSDNEFVWAIEGVSFNVEKGDVLGIVGKNGAGKSTLLKILSKVTSPTKGTIKAAGRIASLLEVGTGFHPELTGRENIFLNGAILGMTKKEIKSKIVEIIDFSGCIRYIDTPVKRYSSGMKVRLAFAVAAHLEPEILVVDEVLAVGDAEFQKKAIGKMRDISNSEGRTVLFVSHNMAAVRSICNKAVLLQNGQLTHSGSADMIVDQYLKLNSSKMVKNVKYKDNPDLFENEDIKIHEISISPEDPMVENELTITFDLEVKSSEEGVFIAFDVLNMEELIIFGSGNSFDKGSGGKVKASGTIPANLMNDGSFLVNLYIQSKSMRPILVLKNILSFEMKDNEREYAYYGKINGLVRPQLKWNSI